MRSAVLRPLLGSALALLALAVGGCSPQFVRMIKHDLDLAAADGAEFAYFACVARDYDRAHTMLIPPARRQGTPQQLGRAMERMHEIGFPTSVTIVDLAPIPGKTLIILYGEGSDGDNIHYYRILMEGATDRGYRVADFRHQMRPFHYEALRNPLAHPATYTPTPAGTEPAAPPAAVKGSNP